VLVVLTTNFLILFSSPNQPNSFFLFLLLLPSQLPSQSTAMASRSFSKSARSPLARQLAAPRVQQRTFVAARSLVRRGAVARPAAIAGPAQQQIRGVKTIDFAGTKEDVYGEFFPSR
jgi:hypothetical protein